MLFEEERALQAELVANQVTPEERKEVLVARARAHAEERLERWLRDREAEKQPEAGHYTAP